MKNNLPGAIVIEGHVQGLSNTRSLGCLGIPVYIIDVRKCIASSSNYCKKFFICPDFQTEEFIEFLIDLAKRENLYGWVLIPSNDHAVYVIAKNKFLLETFYKIPTSDLSIIDNIYDKTKLLKIAENAGIHIPVTQCFSKVDELINPGLKFPVLTKGKNGLSFYKTIGKKALIANNESELKEQLSYIESKYNVDRTFTQELIPFDGTNKTISFTAFCIGGVIKTYWMGVKLREHPLQFGTATFAKSVYVKECYEQSIPLLMSLNYTGVCEVEYLKDPRSGEYKLIEINARTWLWVGLAKTCGVDYAKIIYDFVNNIPIDYPSTYETNKYWINPVTDLTYSFIAIIKKKQGIIEYFRSLRAGKITNALFLKNDIKPGIRYLIDLISIFRKR